MRSYTILLSLILGISGVQAQNFIRGYSNAPFAAGPPALIAEDATELSNGNILFSSYSGYLTHTQSDGKPLATFSLQRPVGSGLLNLSGLADAGNGFYMAGVLSSDSLFFLKANVNGNISWQKAYTAPGISFRALITTQDGGMLLLCMISKSGAINSIPVLTKLDANGNLQWQRKYYSSTLGNGRLSLYNVSQTANGDYLLTGSITPALPVRVTVIRVSSSGSVLWAKEVAATNNSNEYGTLVQELTNGNIKVAVNYPSVAAKFGVMLLDANGNLISAAGYGGIASGINSGEITTEGELTGAIINSGTVFRLANDGSTVFSYDYVIPGGSFMYMNKSVVSHDGGILSYGGYTFSIFGDFTPLLIKTAELGTVPSGFSTPVTLTSVGYAPVLSPTVVTDSTSANSLSSFALSFTSSATLYDSLFAVPTPIEVDHQPFADLSVFPNPAHTSLFVHSSSREGELYLRDLSGRELMRVAASELSEALDISHLPEGIYLVTLSHNGYSATRLVHIYP